MNSKNRKVPGKANDALNCTALTPNPSFDMVAVLLLFVFVFVCVAQGQTIDALSCGKAVGSMARKV